MSCQSFDLKWWAEWMCCTEFNQLIKFSFQRNMIRVADVPASTVWVSLRPFCEMNNWLFKLRKGKRKSNEFVDVQIRKCLGGRSSWTQNAFVWGAVWIRMRVCSKITKMSKGALFYTKQLKVLYCHGFVTLKQINSNVFPSLCQGVKNKQRFVLKINTRNFKFNWPE